MKPFCSIAALEWPRAGMALQRTKTRKSDFEIQPGFLIGVTFWRIDFSLGRTGPTIVLAIAVNF